MKFKNKSQVGQENSCNRQRIQFYLSLFCIIKNDSRKVSVIRPQFRPQNAVQN